MNFPMKRLLLGLFASAWLVGCSPGSDSSLKADEQDQPARFEHPFDAFRQPINSRRAGEIIGLLTPADPTATAKCARCHAEFRTEDGLRNLYSQTYSAYFCLASDGSANRAKLTLSCLASLSQDGNFFNPYENTVPKSDAEIEAGIRNLKPGNLGLFSAAVETAEFKAPFVSAGFEKLYDELKPNVFMPMRGKALSKDDFQTLLNWVMSDSPGKEAMLTHEGPSDVCSDNSKSFVGEHVRAHVKKMSEEGEGWKFVNMARGVSMFACDGTNCFQNQVQGKDVFAKVDGLLAGQGEVRQLFTLKEPSNFWTRSSADGRFVAYGASPRSTIVDLLPMLQGKGMHVMKVEADYDPAFTPDNQAFIFQGGMHGTRVCSQSLLAKADLETINFINQGCSESDLNIGLYQAISSSLDNGDITTINGSFKSDQGSQLIQDIPPFFPEASAMTISTVRLAEATNFEKVSSQNIATPFEANWMISPSQKLAMGTISAATPEKRARHGGYHLVMTNSDEIRAGLLPGYQDDDSAVLCVGAGEKPTISFDERFFVYYAYEKHEGNGMEAVDPRTSSADLFVIDLLGDGQPTKITNMPKGRFAQFPHFRSDGWLYFTIFDANTNERSVVASDAILKL